MARPVVPVVAQKLFAQFGYIHAQASRDEGEQEGESSSQSRAFLPLIAMVRLCVDHENTGVAGLPLSRFTSASPVQSSLV